jgi:hypothetical protein
MYVHHLDGAMSLYVYQDIYKSLKVRTDEKKLGSCIYTNIYIWMCV